MSLYEPDYLELKNGEKLAYRKDLNGIKNVILLHGNYCSSVVWSTVMEEFSGHYNLYAPDLRGFGDSSYNRNARDIKSYADDIVEFIDILGLDEVYLIGWSAGGAVAMEVAATIKDRAKVLVLISSISSRGYSSDYSMPLAMAKLARFMFPVPMYFLDNMNLFQRVSDLTNDRKELGLYLDTLLFNRTKPPKELREDCIDALLKQRNNLDYWEAMTNFNITDGSHTLTAGSSRINLITAPVIVMHGIYDKIVLMKDANQILSDFGDRATFISFKNSGHCPFLDEEKKFMSNLRWSIDKSHEYKSLIVG